MKTALVADGGGFELATVPDPEPQPDQVIVKVLACGICGSDIKAHPFMPAGTIMGHEFCGEVVATGKDVGPWKQNRLVAVLPAVSCGLCTFCRIGEIAHCSQVQFLGMGQEPGGLAEFVAVGARHAYPLPPNLPGIAGALVEPFAVGLHCTEAAGIQAGHRVLIVGGGGVGQTAVVWARAFDAGRISVVDPLAARRDHAISIGASDTLSSVSEAEIGKYDIVIECVGRPDLLEMCVPAIRPKGKLVLAGAYDSNVEFFPLLALLKELTIRFSVAYGAADFKRVIDAFASGTIDPMRMLGPTMGLASTEHSFDLTRTAGSNGRVLVQPGVVS